MPSLIYTSCCFKCIIPTYVAQQIARWSEKSCSAPAVGSARGSAAMLLQHKPAEGWQCVYVNRLLCQFPAKKKAASDALTAGQIQSCFYRQRENPLTVAVLGIICSPWVMWTTRWKKKRRLIQERKKEDNIITVFHYVLWASWTTLLPKDSSQIICTSLEKKCHTTSDVQKHLSFMIPTHSHGFHWDNDDNQRWLQPVTHFSSPL